MRPGSRQSEAPQSTSLSSTHQAARHLLSGSAYVFLAEGLILPTGLITAAFLTRRLGPAGYGLYTLATVIVAWIEWCITAVFSRATVKLAGEAEDWRPWGSTVVRLHLVVSTASALLLCLLSAPLAALLKEPVLAGYLRVFALDIPLFSLAVGHRDLLIARGSFRERARASAARWITRPCFIILLVEAGLSVEGAILGSVAASLVDVAVARYYVRPRLWGEKKVPVRRLWEFAVPLFAYAVVSRAYDRLDLLFLQGLGGNASLAGIYGGAQNFSLVPAILGVSVSPLLLSTLTRCQRAGEREMAAQLTRQSLRAALWTFPFAGLVAGCASEIVTFVLGAAFQAAAPLLELLIFGALARFLVSLATAALIAADKPSWPLRLTGPMVPLAIAGHLLLIPRLGALGAALVTTTCSLLAALATLLAVAVLWGVRPPAVTMARAFLLCVLAYLLARSWSTPGVLVLLKLAGISLLIPFLYWRLREFGPRELALLRSFVVPQDASRAGSSSV